MSNKENNTDYSSNEELQKDYRKMVSDMRAMEIEQEDKELRILNRIIRWSDDGLEYEADQRHS